MIGVALAQAVANAPPPSFSPGDPIFGAIQRIVERPNGVFLLCLAVIVIFLFASERYAKPTYDRARNGFIGQIAPRFLTSDSRYVVGLNVYIGIILLAFLLLTLAGSQISGVLFGSVSQLSQTAQAAGDTRGPALPPEVWPLLVALGLVGLGSASDDSVLGRLEFRVRQFAHERAFIPEGTQLLARRLASEQLGVWHLPVGRRMLNELQQRWISLNKNAAGENEFFKLLREYIDAALLDAQSDSKSQFRPIRELKGDSFKAGQKFNNYMDKNGYSRTIYSLIMLDCGLRIAQDSTLVPREFDSDNAEIFLSLIGRVDEIRRNAIASDKLYDSDELIRDLRKCRNDFAVLLASSMLRARPNDEQLAMTLAQIGFEDDGIPIRRSWSSYLVIVLVMLLTGAMFCYFAVASWYGLIVRSVSHAGTDELNMLTSQLPFGLLNAIAGYLVVFVVFTAHREGKLRLGEWRESPYFRIMAVIVSTTVATIGVLFINILALQPRPTVEWLVNVAVVPILVCFAAGSFLNVHVAKAATAKLRVEEDRVLGSGDYVVRPRTTWGLCLSALPLASVHATLVAILVGLPTYFFYLGGQLQVPRQNVMEAGQYAAELSRTRAAARGQPFNFRSDTTGTGNTDNRTSREVISRLNNEYQLSMIGALLGRVSNHYTRHQTGFGSGLNLTSRDRDRQNVYFTIVFVCDYLSAVRRFEKITPSDAVRDIDAARKMSEEPPHHWADLKKASDCDPAANGVAATPGNTPSPADQKTSPAGGQTIAAPNAAALEAQFLQQLTALMTSASQAQSLVRELVWTDTNAWGELWGSKAARAAFAAMLVSAFTAFVLAFFFSVAAHLGRCNEIDEFFTAVSYSGMRKLAQELAKFDGRPIASRDALAESLAKRRSILSELTIQESLMSDGTYLRFQDALVAIDQNKDAAFTQSAAGGKDGVQSASGSL